MDHLFLLQEILTAAIMSKVTGRDGMAAQGQYGGRIGAEEFHSGKVRDILIEAGREASERALANGKRRAERAKAYGPLGQTICDTKFAPTEKVTAVVNADYTQDPRSTSLDELCKRATAACTSMLKVDERMRRALVQIQSGMNRELIVASENGEIAIDVDEAYAKTQGLVHVFALAPGQKVAEDYYDALGGMHGLEVLDGRNLYCQPFERWAMGISDQIAKLSSAPMLEGRFDNVKVLTDGAFNSLWTHEVNGHPSEGDRVKGMEMGYAGRSWFFRNALEHWIGKQVASPLLNVTSRNDLDAYGKFMFDAEGTRGTPVYHIKDGKFVGFLHSRWTAQAMTDMGIANQVPNGSMRATNALNVPYIRMKQTGIEGGTSSIAQMLAMIDDGFYLVGRKIPSMSESRENFQISPMMAFRIQNGRVGQMYRRVSLMADSMPYMMSIIAIGNDVGLHNIFNCGKAQPQQVMYLCNFAPSMLAIGNMIGGLAKAA